MLVCRVWGCFLSLSYRLIYLNSAFKTSPCGEGEGHQAEKLGLCCYHRHFSSEAAKEVAVASPRKTSHGIVKDLRYLVQRQPWAPFPTSPS